MSTTSKKIVSVALTASTMFWGTGALSLVSVANAQATDLQAIINNLQAQIATLQAQLNGTTGGDTMMMNAFTRTLTVGMRGDDVMNLQKFLNENGAQIASSGAGSPGNETTYFGPKTRTALAAYQAAQNPPITPSVGFFGPKTKTYVNGLLAVVPPPASGDLCLNIAGVQATVPAGYTRDTAGNCSLTGVVVPGTGLQVSLASDNPAAGALISGSTAAARVPVLAVNLTAGSAGGVTVNDLKFRKQGVLSDTAISSAYLIENGKVLVQYSSLSQGVLSFVGLGLGVNAGQTRKLWLAVDPATGLSAGNTVSFSMTSSSDVAAVSNTNTAVATTGSFPLNGNIFTVTTVSNPSIATLVFASSSVGTSIYAGTQDVLVSQWTVTGGNSPLDLKSINFKVIGSANKTDIKNVKLKVNGTQFGPTLAQVAPDGSAYFDLSSAPARLNTGSSNMQIYADVTGSPSYTFQFELLNSYDIYANDSQYGVPVAVTINGGVGIQISILQGSLTVSLATGTPTGNIAKGGSGTALAKFKIYAAGEPVKVKYLDFSLTLTGTTTTISSMFKNVVLVDDAGNQVGTTINTPPTSNSCEGNGTSFTAGYNAAGTIYRDCFGTGSSNINYTVPANTTRVLTLRADVQSGAGFSTVVGALLGNQTNLQGQTSSQTANSGAVNGSALTLAANSLTVAANSAIGAQTFSAGTNGARIGSYALTASSAEGASLNTITVLTSASSTNFVNLRVMVDGNQVGITWPTLTASASYTFSGSVNVPAGQTKIVDVIADILTGTVANTYTAVTTLSACSGQGVVTFTAISCSSTGGQNIVLAGQATLTITAVSSQPSDQIVMGTMGATLAKFNLQETSNVEDIKITDMFVFQQVAATNTVLSAFGNSLKLYNDAGLKLADQGARTTYASTSNPGPGYYYKFSFANPIVVPKSSALTLTLKGDVSSYSSSGVTDNTTHVFKIVTATADTAVDTASEVVVASGLTSNATSTVILSSATGPTKTTQRSKLTFSALASGSNLIRQAGTELARLTFTPSSGGSASINSITVTFSGNAASSPTFLDGLSLVDLANPAVNISGSATSSNVTSSKCTNTGSCARSFVIGTTVGGLDVNVNTPKTLLLIYDGSTLQTAIANTAMTLSAIINAQGDIVYTDDAVDATAVGGIVLPSDVRVPINLGYHSAPVGQ